MRKIGLVASCICFSILSCSNPVQPLPSTVNLLRPPSTFKESDLIGVWQVTYGGAEVDTITIRSDKTYQQVFKGANNYYYAGGPNKWWVEYRSSGCVYVHLEGARYYAGIRERAEGEGIDSMGEPYNFWDGCENQLVQMVRKVILRVNSSPGALQGIELVQMKDNFEGSNQSFFLISTSLPSATPGNISP